MQLPVNMISNDETNANFASSSAGLAPVQSSSMMEGQHHSTDMASYTSESEFMPLNDEELDSKSGSDNQETKSGDDEQANANQRPKRKRYNRHTHNQIQALETFFKGCPHPDDNQRMELARQLGLKPMQVKFWFQNKRTQTKNHFEHNENALLRAENEKYKAENVYLREALNNAAICPTCRGPTNNLGELSYAEHLLKLENNRLSEEVGRISAIAANFVGKPVSSFNVDSPLVTPHSLDLGVQPYSTQHNVIGDAYGSGGERMISGPTEVEKPFIIEVAVAAMEELIQMANMGEPLWLPSIDDGTNFLNENEYARIFPRGIGPKPEGFKTEASKETAVVILNHNNLVEIFMDVDHWSSMFSNIVSSAVTLDVLSTGAAGNFNGALQVIFAEFQVPSPQIPTRECYFVRYCKQSVDGIWAIVDVSLDHLRGNPTARCRRRPSGCLIQEMPNGYSKVTWIEHIDADDSAIHDIYKPLVNYGLAFGAKRWLATLDRQCERLASAMASIIPNNDINNMVISTQEAKKSTLRLAERMVISFCSGVSATAAHQWTTLSGSGLDSDVRIMTRKSIDDPGKPSGIVLSVATSFWLPICPNRVFDFLRDENTRSQWDILSNGGIVQEMAHIANGRENGNCVSLLRVINENSSESNMLILQESSTDPTGSFVVYAPVDVPSMNIVLGGGEPDYVALLPSGFAILPDGPPGNNGVGVGNGAGSGGSLLTVAFQILVDSVPTAKLSLGSVATVNKLIDCTVDRIKASLLSEAHDF